MSGHRRPWGLTRPAVPTRLRTPLGARGRQPEQPGRRRFPPRERRRGAPQPREKPAPPTCPAVPWPHAAPGPAPAGASTLGDPSAVPVPGGRAGGRVGASPCEQTPGGSAWALPPSLPASSPALTAGSAGRRRPQRSSCCLSAPGSVPARPPVHSRAGPAPRPGRRWPLVRGGRGSGQVPPPRLGRRAAVAADGYGNERLCLARSV